ncbi:MAG: 23S rRNA (guanosine(2251)-2'-O)-methyltransferase RlmB [Bacilli bacterium]|nr:23S rRNA (guanosine(2251)-2'-O)-methyltransferase RlmB [Bacilli bacterium]
MLVFGRNVLKEIENQKIKKVYISKTIKDKSILEYLKNNKIKYEIVDNNYLDRMTKLNHQGIIIDMYEYEYHKLEDCYNEDFVVLLDHLEDPHNLGAIIRTCECAGIKSIIIPKDRSVRINETVMKVSCGALNNVKVIMVNNLVDSIKKLQKENYFIYSADMKGEDYHNLNYDNKKVLVIGNEGSGISRLIKENSDFLISIPMYGNINSLNASVASGILIYGMLGGVND